MLDILIVEGFVDESLHMNLLTSELDNYLPRKRNQGYQYNSYFSVGIWLVML